MTRTYVSALVPAGLIACLLISPASATAAARDAAKVWAVSVMPALFPFVTLSLLLVSYVSGARGSNRAIMGLTIALGMLGGSPSGARLLAYRAADGKLSRRSAQCAASCIATASPMFILSTLTSWLGASRRVGFIMLASHEMAAILTGVICLIVTSAWHDGAYHHSAPNIITHAANDTKVTKPLSLANAIAEASSSMLSICGCMMLFSAATAVISSLFKLPPTAFAILSAALEMAGGSAKICALGLSLKICAPIICAVLSFGGASVFAQNWAFFSKAGVNIALQFTMRVISAIISYAICSLMLM